MKTKYGSLKGCIKLINLQPDKSGKKLGGTNYQLGMRRVIALQIAKHKRDDKGILWATLGQ